MARKKQRKSREQEGAIQTPRGKARGAAGNERGEAELRQPEFQPQQAEPQQAQPQQAQPQQAELHQPEPRQAPSPAQATDSTARTTGAGDGVEADRPSGQPPAQAPTVPAPAQPPTRGSRPRPVARPASWARAGWTPDGGQSLGIAGAARKPGAPGTHVTSSAPNHWKPAPSRPIQPAAPAHPQGTDRPVVRVSLAEAAAAGRQSLRPLSPVARGPSFEGTAQERQDETSSNEGRPVRHVGTASSGSVTPVPGLRTSGQEPGAHLGAGERPVRHVGTATSGSATPVPGLRSSGQEPATPQPPAGERPVRHMGTATSMPGGPEASSQPFATATGPRTAPWARPVTVVDATGPREPEKAPRRKEVPPALPMNLPDPDARYFAVAGLSSPACVERVEKAARTVPGVTEAEANLAAGVVAVSPATADASAIAGALAGAGHPPLPDLPGAAAAKKGALRSFGAAAGVLAIGVAAAVLDRTSGPLSGTLVAALSLAAGWPAVGPGLGHLIRARMSAEILPLIASVAILVVSFLEPDEFSSGLAAAPLFVHLIGMSIVQLARARALGILAKLREALPQSRGIAVGDVVTVGAGEVIPVDGRLLETAVLDERIFGGEDDVERLQGENIAAGTIALQGARLTATAQAERGRLWRGLAIAERALSTHPSGTPAAWASRLIVPVALAAAAAGVVWGGTWVGAAVLAASASLGLALTGSLSTAAAVTRAASRGVAVRSSEALDRAGRTEQVLFDKSSTLTRGDTAVLEFLVKPGKDPQALLGQITAAHVGIDHPISRALTNHAADVKVAVPRAKDVDYQPGLGVRATVDGREVLVGSIHHSHRCGVEIGLLSQTVDELARRGRTPLIAAIDGDAVAVLGLADTPRESARQTVGSLELLDVGLRIASGDATPSVQWLAEGIGLDRRVARGDLGPEAKRELVEELRGEGPCLMAGANVVDVPALQAADLAVSVGVHPEVEAVAGALLIRQDPHGVVELVRAGRALRRGRRLATIVGVTGNVGAMALAGMGWIGVGGAAALALCTNLLSIGAAASPWIRIR